MKNIYIYRFICIVVISNISSIVIFKSLPIYYSNYLLNITTDHYREISVLERSITIIFRPSFFQHTQQLQSSTFLLSLSLSLVLSISLSNKKIVNHHHHRILDALIVVTRHHLVNNLRYIDELIKNFFYFINSYI